MTTRAKRGKLGYEDVEWGLGTFTRYGPTGAIETLNQIRASHIPILDAGGDYAAADVEAALVELVTWYNALQYTVRHAGGFYTALWEHEYTAACTIEKNIKDDFDAVDVILADHGLIGGLTDDDHASYPLVTNFEATRAALAIAWTDLTDGGASTAHKHDHGGQDGLADDDHSKYPLVTNFEATRAALVTAWDDLTDGGASTAHKHDHGAMDGLADDDHAMYPLVTNFEATRAALATAWTDLTDAGATTLHKHDHGGGDGLSDDDHTQYLLADGTRSVSGLLTLLADLKLTGIHPHIDLNEDDSTDVADFWRIEMSADDLIIYFWDDSAAAWRTLIRLDGVARSLVACDILKDEDAMGSDSAVHVATQQSIKAYVDLHILHSLADAANDFLVASGANVYVKKTLAETGAILEADINHDNLVDFAAGEHFTMLDEDNMATNSATQAATQQSIKAYVDAAVAGAGGFDAGTVMYFYQNVAPTDWTLVAISDVVLAVKGGAQAYNVNGGNLAGTWDLSSGLTKDAHTHLAGTLAGPSHRHTVGGETSTKNEWPNQTVGADGYTGYSGTGAVTGSTGAQSDSGITSASTARVKAAVGVLADRDA